MQIFLDACKNSTLIHSTICAQHSKSNKNFEVINHDFKRSPFAIQDKNSGELDYAKDFPTIADLMREQKVLKKKLIQSIIEEIWILWLTFNL